MENHLLEMMSWFSNEQELTDWSGPNFRIVVIGYYVIGWQLPLIVKIFALFVLSFSLTSVICIFIIKPFNVCRVLFGLKKIDTSPSVISIK